MNASYEKCSKCGARFSMGGYEVHPCIISNKDMSDIKLLKQIDATKNAIIIEFVNGASVVYIECCDDKILPKLKKVASLILQINYEL